MRYCIAFLRCVFHHEMTRPRSIPWCPTSSLLPAKTLKGAPCSIPFLYKGILYNACTTADNGDKLWCSLDYSYDGNWDNCDISICPESCGSGMSQTLPSPKHPTIFFCRYNVPRPCDQSRGRQRLFPCSPILCSMKLPLAGAVCDLAVLLVTTVTPSVKLLIVHGYYIMAETKWPPFRRRQFQTHFLECKCNNVDWNFTAVCSWGSNEHYSSIGTDNGLAPTWR